MYLAKVIKNTLLKSNVTEKDTNSTIYIHRDIPYKPGSNHPKHCLNIFVPKIGASDDEQQNGQLLPVLIFVHGGSWRRGDRNHRWFDTYNKFCAQLCCNMEMVVVNISYRLSPEVKHPEHMIDVLYAFQFVHNFISQYNGDANRVLVCGHSAGGHLVTMCTLYTVCPVPLFNELNVPKSDDDDDSNHHHHSFDLPTDFVKGCIPISAVYDLNRVSTMGYLVNRYILEPAFNKHETLNHYDDGSPIEKLRKLISILRQRHSSTPPLANGDDSCGDGDVSVSMGEEKKKKEVPSDAELLSILPPFMCLNAENDWGLEVQTDDWIQVLNDPKRFIKKRYFNSGTNHLSVIGLHTGYGQAYPLVITDIAEFAHSIFQMDGALIPIASPIDRSPKIIPFQLDLTTTTTTTSATTTTSTATATATVTARTTESSALLETTTTTLTTASSSTIVVSENGGVNNHHNNDDTTLFTALKAQQEQSEDDLRDIVLEVEERKNRVETPSPLVGSMSVEAQQERQQRKQSENFVSQLYLM